MAPFSLQMEPPGLPGRFIKAGNNRARRLPVEAAWAASRKRDSCLKARFLRLKGRHGPKKAILAVAASMMVAVFHMLRDGVEYQDLGSDHFERRDRAKIARRLIQRLEELGLEVKVVPVAA